MIDPSQGKPRSACSGVDPAPCELQKALQSLASLIRKSEKARQKLAPKTWQHAMLRDYLKALRMASALMNGKPCAADGVAPDDLQDALRSLGSMIGKTEKALEKFSANMSPHTLLLNRLQALRMAEASIKLEIAKWLVPGQPPQM